MSDRIESLGSVERCGTFWDRRDAGYRISKGRFHCVLQWYLTLTPLALAVLVHRASWCRASLRTHRTVKVPVHDARNLCDERMLTERGRFPDRLALSIEVKYLCDRGENLSHILRALCAAGDTVPAMPRRWFRCGYGLAHGW